jgi:nucleotide-binding universal stress UspA family protein
MDAWPRFPLAGDKDRVLTRWRSDALDATLYPRARAGRTMRGTILCLVDDNPQGRAALKAAADLGDRLKLRLVLAHVADGGDAASANGDGVRTRRREGAALVARLAAELGLSDRAEHRSAVGDPATVLGQIAAEEAADLIVAGAPPGRRLRRSSETRIAEHLESATAVPVMFVRPRSVQ